MQKGPICRFQFPVPGRCRKTGQVLPVVTQCAWMFPIPPQDADGVEFRLLRKTNDAGTGNGVSFSSIIRLNEQQELHYVFSLLIIMARKRRIQCPLMKTQTSAQWLLTHDTISGQTGVSCYKLFNNAGNRWNGRQLPIVLVETVFNKMPINLSKGSVPIK